MAQDIEEVIPPPPPPPSASAGEGDVPPPPPPPRLSVKDNTFAMDMAEATNPGSTKVEGTVDMANKDAIPDPAEIKVAKTKVYDNDAIRKQKRSNGLTPEVHEQAVLKQAKLAEAKVMAAKQNALYFYDDNKLVPYEKPQIGLVNKQPEDNMGFSVTPNPEVANMKQTVDYYAKFLAENDPIKYDAYKSKLKYLEGGGFIGKAPETEALNKEQALFTEDAIKFRSDLAGLKIKQIEEEIGKGALDALEGLNSQLGVIAKEYDAAKDPAQKNAIAEKYNAASAQIKQLLAENGLEDKLKSMDEAYKNASSSISAGQTFVQQFPKYAAEKLQAEQDQEMVDLKNEYKKGAGGFADRYGYNITSQLGRGITRMVGGIMGLPQSLSFNNDYGATDRWADIFSEGTKHFDEEFLPQPKKFENSLFKEDGKIDTSLLLPKSVGMLTDMAILIGGGMATGGGLVAAGMGNTKLALSVGTVASSFAMTNKGYYDEAIKGGMSSKGASAFASVLSLQQGLLELINPEAVIFRKQLSTRVTKNFIDNLLSGVSTKEAFGLASKAVFKNIVGENIQELSQTIDEKLSKFAAYKLFGTKFENMDLTANEVAETVVLTTIASGLTGGVLGGMSEQRSELERQSLYTASVNVNETLAAIAKKVADGTMTQTQADIIQTAVVRLNSNLNILPGHLTEQQNSDIVNLMYDKLKIESGIANDNIDPLLRTKGEEQIKLIDTEIEKILEQGQPNYEIDGKAVTKQEFTQQIADPAFKEAVKSGKTNIKITNDQAFVDTVNSALGFDHTGEKAAPDQGSVNPEPTPEQQQQIAVLNENRAVELAKNEQLPPEEQVSPDKINEKFDNDIKLLQAQPVPIQIGIAPIENGGNQQDEAGVAGANPVVLTPEQVQAENEKAKVDNEKQTEERKKTIESLNGKSVTIGNNSFIVDQISGPYKQEDDSFGNHKQVDEYYQIVEGSGTSMRIANVFFNKNGELETLDAGESHILKVNDANNKAGSQDNNKQEDKGKPAEDKKSENDKPGEGNEQGGGKLAIDVLHGLVKRFNGINKPERKNNPALVDALRAKINEIASQIGLKVVDVPGRGKSFIQLEDKKGKRVKPAPEKIRVKPLSEFEVGDVVYSPSDKSKYQVMPDGKYKDVKESSKTYGDIISLDPNKQFVLAMSAMEAEFDANMKAARGVRPSDVRSAVFQIIGNGAMLTQDAVEHEFGKKIANGEMRWLWFGNNKQKGKRLIDNIDVGLRDLISEATGIPTENIEHDDIHKALFELSSRKQAMEMFMAAENIDGDVVIAENGDIEADVEKMQRDREDEMINGINNFFEANGISDESVQISLIDRFGGINNLNMLALQDFLDEVRFNAELFAEIDPSIEEQVMAEVTMFRDENGNIDMDALEKGIENIEDENLKEAIKNYINDTKNKGINPTGSDKGSANGPKAKKLDEEVEKGKPPLGKSREEIIADIEAKKIEVAAAQVEYDKAKKALDKDLEAKQANLFAGGIEQKLFNDEADLAKEVESRKKKLGALMDGLNTLNTMLENNLKGQQGMDFGGDNVVEEPKPTIQKTVQGDLFSSLVEGDYPVQEEKKPSKAKGLKGFTIRTIRSAWTVMKNIQFTGSTRVESAADVAEIMKMLENKAVEHGFAVHIDKKGNSHIQFLSIGGRTSTVIDPRSVLDGVAKFGSVKVYLVHNHPTGNMTPSQNDIDLTNDISLGLDLLKVEMEHVIMDTYKKEYVLLRAGGRYTVETRGAEKNNANLETHHYSDKEVLTAPIIKVTDSRAAALAIQQLRFTAMPKNAMLILDRANNVVANYVFTGEITLKKINDALGEIGASGVIFYGNNIDTQLVNGLSPHLKRLKIDLLDIVQVPSDGADVVGYYTSMADEGTLREDQEKYKTGPDSLPTVNEPDVDLKQQVQDFGVAKKDTEAQIGLIEKLFSGLKKAGLVAAKNVEDWVNIGKGNSKKQALNDVIIAANIQKVASSLGFDLGLPLDINGASLKKQAQEQLPVNTPVANGYDVIKKKLGETAAKAVRQHIPFALDYPNEFIAFITEKIPVKESIAEVVGAIPARLDALFRIAADKTIETTVASVDSPEDLAKSAGYVFHQPKSEEDILVFKKDFQNGELLCTYNNVGGRMSSNLIFWIRRANAETVLHATEVTQEYLEENTEGAQLWRGYLDARGLKKADGTYDISNLRPERQDPYGTSSMSVQIGKSNGIISIKNRYNHTVSSPDATFGNDLNNIASGLDAAVYAMPGVPSKSKQQASLPNGLTSDADGRFFRYDFESNNVYFSRLGYMKHGVITAIDKSTQAIRDEVLFDAKNKIALNLASTEQLVDNIESVSIQKDNITVKTKNGSLVLGLLPINGNIISVSGDIETINTDFFSINETIRNVDLPNVVSVGRNFLQNCIALQSVVMPKVKSIGHNFIYSGRNISSIELPSVEIIGHNFLSANQELDTLQSVVMPKVKSIGHNFIYSGRNISSIELPSVEIIGHNFLSANQELDTISLPNLIEVGDSFLRQSMSIDNFNLPSLKIIGDDFMHSSKGFGDINLPSVESVGSLFIPVTMASKVNMPSVKIVGRNFMYNAGNITDIDFPELQSVGDSFFSRNTDIENVSLPNLRMVGSGFLEMNNSIEEISLPEATHIGSSFLHDAINLKHVSLPNAIRIGSEFILNGRAVESVHLPKVSDIANSFMTNNKNIESISLPNLKIVDTWFLTNNTSIKSVSLPKATNIGSRFLGENNSIETLEAPFVQEIWDEFLENNNSIKSLFFPNLVSVGINFMPKNTVMDGFYAPRMASIGENFLSNNGMYAQLSGYIKKFKKEWRVVKGNEVLGASSDKAKMESLQKDNEGSTLVINTVGQPLLKKAQAQYHVESGKGIVQALQNFNGSPAATVALTHEIMHPTVVAIFDGAKEGNETGLKHANTIVDEYNKANPRNKVTLDEMIADNDAFKEGSTSDNYRNVQEFIAESWEQYHYEGKQGFSKAFQDILDQITEAFKTIYKSLSGNQLTPELRQMFDDILGKVAPQKEVPGTSFGDNISFTNVNGTEVAPTIPVSKKLQTELSKIASENNGKRTENGYTFETKEDAERAATQMQAAYYNEISPRTLTLDEKIQKAFDDLKAVKDKIKQAGENIGIASNQAENDAELLAAYTNLAYLFIKSGLKTAKEFIGQLSGAVNEDVAKKAYDNALNSIMEFKKNFKKDRGNGMGLKELMAKYASKEFDLDYIVDEWNGATDDISPEEAAYASTGVFDDTAPKTKSSDGKLSPMEVPELVQLAKAILGKYPTVERLQHALGMFVPSKEQLRITNEMFKAEHLEDLAKVLAHEIGHVIDFMPDKAMGKGNILGRLASIRDFMGKILPFKEGMPGALTKDDLDRLTAEAKALNPDGKTITMIEEEIEKEFGITADDVKAIWNAIDPSQKNKALEDYIKGLSDKQKALIVKAAMKGMVADELKNFITKVKVKTGNMIAVETIVKGEWKKTLDKLIQDEIAKRQAFELKKIHDEALALSVWWRPMSENPTAKERSYRHSSVEIYADMISVLFNSPGEFEKRAPNVMQAFFNYFDKKPEVKAAYEELMAAISDPETIAQQRLQNILDANKRGTEAYKAARAAKETVNLLTLFKRQFLSVSYPLLDKFVNESVPGLVMSEKQRLRQALDMMNYASGRVFDVMSSYEKNVINPLTAAGVDLNDMSALLQARRNIGDRSDIANPLGMQGELVNQGMIDKVMSKYTPEQQDVINKALDTFYALTFETMKKGNDAGLYTKDMWDTIEKNKDSYATYRVIKYIDGKLVSAGLYEATGTLQEVANPFFETMVKMTQIEKAIIRNNAVKIAVEMLAKHHPDDIKFARRISKSSFQHAPAGWASLNYKVQGRTVSVHTDKRIVEIFNKFNPHEVSALFQFWGKANVLFKGIYTGFNYSFGLVRNPVKDSMRSIRAITAILHGHKETKRLKNVVTVPLVYAKNFLKSLPASAKLASGITTRLTHDMIESGAVSPESILYSDYDAFANPEMQMLGRFKEVSEHLGMDSSTGRTKWKNALRALGFLPSILEYNSKIASYRTFLDYGLSNELAAYHTRINTGTPDFKERTGLNYGNFMYAKTTLQGLRAEAGLIADPSTRAGYFLSLFMQVVPAALAYVAFTKGWWGGDDDEDKELASAPNESIKRQFMMESSWDKLRYITIPTGLTDDKTKVGRVKIPMDEMQALFYGAIINAFSDVPVSEKIKNQLTSLGGLVPALINPEDGMPMWEIFSKWTDYVKGNNPIDNFRNKEIVNPNKMKAGFIYSAPDMLAWTAGKFNVKFDYKNPNATAKDFMKNNIPVWSAIYSETNFGDIEEIQRIKKEVDSRRAAHNIDMDQAIQKEYNSSLGSEIEKNKTDLKQWDNGFPTMYYTDSKVSSIVLNTFIKMFPDTKLPPVNPETGWFKDDGSEAYADISYMKQKAKAYYMYGLTSNSSVYMNSLIDANRETKSLIIEKYSSIEPGMAEGFINFAYRNGIIDEKTKVMSLDALNNK